MSNLCEQMLNNFFAEGKADTWLERNALCLHHKLFAAAMVSMEGWFVANPHVDLHADIKNLSHMLNENGEKVALSMAETLRVPNTHILKINAVSNSCPTLYRVNHSSDYPEVFDLLKDEYIAAYFNSVLLYSITRVYDKDLIRNQAVGVHSALAIYQMNGNEKAEEQLRRFINKSLPDMIRDCIWDCVRDVR